jgi:hypothetical protein
MFTTITGELSLMMLIEKYELNGIHVISANTDGVTIKVRKDLIPKMYEINEWWSELTQYVLEKIDYKKIIFSTVNDYIAIMSDGTVKKKGDFLTDFELHKNKSARIIPIALEQYFVNNIPVRETIIKHNNLYDFCIRKNASRDFHYESVDSFNKITKHNKLIRYYVSNIGEKVYKVKNKNSESKAAKRSQVEAGEWKCFVCNYLEKNSKLDNVNFSYYIDKAESMIVKILTNGKSKKNVVIPNQISLF